MDIENELWNLKFNIYRSIRYHDRARGAYDSFAKWTIILSLIFSSSAVGALLKSSEYVDLALWLTALTAILSAINIVLGFNARFVQHSSLRNRFVELQAQIDECTIPTAENIAKFRRERRDIEKDELPTSRGLNVLCYNEAVDALGADQSEKKLLPITGRIWHLFDALQLGAPKH